MELFLKLFDPSGFVPRAQCGEWTTGLIWLHNASDFFIWTAYLAIPIVLLFFAYRRRDELPFRQLFWLFGLFILACGTTHLIDIVLFYYPIYRLAGVVKFITAAASWGTVFALISIVPRALAMRTPEALEREIAERRRVEELLDKERGFLQTLLDNANAGIVACDENGVLTVFNRTSREFHGTTVAPIASEHWAEQFDLYRSDGQTPLPQAEIPLLRALRDEMVRDAEIVIAPKNGVARTLSVNAQAINDEVGNKRGAIAVMHDITERKRIERELQQAHDDLEMRVVQRTLELAHANAELEKSSAQLNAILDNAPAVIYLKDTQGRYLFVNRQFEKSFALSRPQIIGHTDHEIFPGAAADDFVANDRRVLESDAPVEMEEEMPQDDGPLTFISIKFPLHVANGSAYAVCGISTDITGRKRDQVALQIAKDEAENASLAKSQLLSRTSHELRTPLNAILGFGQLLEMDALNEEQQHSVQMILKAGRHQLALVDRILDIARIEAGELPVTLEPVALNFLLQDALRLARPLAAEHQITLRLPDDDCSCVGAQVLADRERLLQVLANLLSNAIQFNHTGGHVTLSCQLASEGNRLRIAVSDNGRGMTPAELKRIFTLFERLGAEAAGIAGVGIGLPLSKGLVEAMNGSLSVQSTSGEGSIFTIELPLTSSAVQPRPTDEDKSATDKAADSAVILYVEDNLSNLELLQFILQQRPATKMLSAMRGRRGLEMARTQQPDLILLDLHLPDIQGDEFLKLLSADPVTRDIPVIMVSADATPRQIKRLMDAGARDYLTKPLNIKNLLEAVGDALKGF